MRPKLTEDRSGMVEPIGGHIGLWVAKRVVQRGAVSFVEPVGEVEWQQLHFCGHGQLGRLVDD
jgi:hypothetical protein